MALVKHYKFYDCFALCIHASFSRNGLPESGRLPPASRAISIG